MIKTILLTGSVLMLTASLISGGQSVWISGKAVVAQWLLNNAWQRSVSTQTPDKAWPWADTAPVARLSIPSLGESFIVLSNASGEALAFGPGLVAGNPDKLSEQAIAIGGHRDTHLSILEAVAPGTRIWLQNIQGQSQQYQINQHQIIDSRTQSIALNQSQAGLVLITCYPFNAATVGGPLRLVLTADPVPFTAPAIDTLIEIANSAESYHVSGFDPHL
ncbi:MAG: class GN sortase [Granulosicoccaceae bacterium]